MNPNRMLTSLRQTIAISIAFVLPFLGHNALAQTPVAGFNVAQGSGCIPFTVQFNNTSQNATSWHWDFGNGNFSTAQHPVNVYLGTGIFSVKLVVFNSSGQADSVTLTNLIQTVSPPTVDFNANNTSACLGNSISFTNLSTGFDSCVWDFGDGINSHTTNPVHQYGTPGVYTITLIAYNSTLGCEASLSKNTYITILSSPATTFTASDTTLCDAQQPVVFQPAPSSANTWHWMFGDGFTSNIQQPSHIYGQPGIYSITLVTTNQLGCSDTLVMPGMIVVSNNPVPSIVSSAPLSQCSPFISTFTTNPSNVVAWWWDFGDGSITWYPNPAPHTYYITGTHTITLEVTYANGCSNTDSLQLQVWNNPLPDYQMTNYQGCSPLPVSFTNNTPGSNTYSWDFGDGTSSNQSSPAHTYTVAGSYSVELTATNSNGCSASYISPNLVQLAQINAAFTVDDPSGCAPHTVNFSHPGGGLYSYSWDFGDGGSSTAQSPSHVYQQTGNYSVTLSISNGQCSSTNTFSSQIQVTNGVNNFNAVTPVEACAPFTVNLYDNSPSTSAWFWDFDDGSTATIQNPVHTFTSGGTYNVSLQTQSSGTNCSQLVDPYGIYIIHGGEADFTLNQSLCPPYTATFTDQSVNAVAWFWDFGDGSTSNLQNPVHIYGAPGSYNVSLTITTADGCTFTEFHNYAVTFLPLIANTTATTSDSTLPMLVNFYANSSGATSWFWDFGNGNTSTLQNPTNLYTTPPPYTLTLIISNGSCSDTIVYNGVTFGSGTVLPGSGGDTLHIPEPVYSCVPYEMNFNNPALNTVAWLWDFGDGDTSTLENPTHIYTDPGIYTVTQITWDAFGISDTIIQPSPFYLTGSSADFQLSYSNTCQGSTILTTNNSLNAVSYLWDFGDGITSTLEEPTHVYNTIGINYIISLSVTDSGGCTDFMARSYYAIGGTSVTASSRRACANDTIFFTNGAMNFTSYQWDFGDGTTANTQNPWHVYADSGSYQVVLTVTDSLNCATSFNVPYQIEINKPVADFSYTISNSPCGPSSVQFTNLSIGADSYFWDFGNGNYASQENPLFDFHSPGNHATTLIATSQGCSDTFTVNNVTYTTSLSPSFSYVQSSECFPITITATDHSLDAVTWYWNFGDGTSSTLQNPVHVFNTMPWGNIMLTVTDIHGCYKSFGLLNITAMNVAASVSDSAGCTPFSISISDSSSNVSSYNWNFGDGTSSSLAAPTHIYNNNGTYPISLTVTAASGCSQVINPVALINTSGPIAQFSQNTVVSCAPTIVNFTDNSTGATQWNWNFGDNNQSVIENPVHIYNQPGNYDITLVVTDDNGCVDTLTSPGMVHITGSSSNFVIAETTGCSPWMVHFQDSSLSAFSWNWNFGDGQTSTQQNPVHTYDTPGNYVVTLMTQDTTGCQSVYSNPTPLTVQPAPVSSFALSDTTGCTPFHITIYNLSGNQASYYWDFGDGSSTTAAHPGHDYNLPGTYYISLVVTDANGCTDTSVATVPVVTAAVPAPLFTVNTNSGCNPLPVQFVNTSTNTNAATVFSWNFGNGITSNSDEPYFIYQQAGVYDVTLTATNGGVCTASSFMDNLIVVSEGAPPPPVEMKSVSVASTNSMEITWGNLTTLNLAAYKVYRFNKVLQLFELIHANNNPNNTSFNATSSYIDSVGSTADETFTYVVQAINTCGSETPLDQHFPHTSINISDTIENNSVLLNWNAYDGCAVGAYEIYRQDNMAGNFNLVATVDPSTLEFTDSTIFCGMWAAYRVKATGICNEGFEAWSDIETAQAPGTLLNQRVDVIRSTVIDDSYVFTEWAPPTLAPQLVTEFELYRSTDNINFVLLATLPAAQTNYSDFDTRVKSEQYMYKVKVKNLCELQTNPGLPGTSILLEGSIDDENRTQLRWSPYRNWDTGVDYYIIERLDLNGMWQPIKVVDGSTLDYIDR